MYQYTLTNDTVTVLIDGEPHAVTKGSPNYDKLRAAVLAEDWAAIPGLLTVEKAVETWFQNAAPAPVEAPVEAPVAVPGDAGSFKVLNEAVTFNGEALPKALNDRILKMVAKNEDPKSLLNFWRRLKRNPNPHSVQQLFGFLVHTGIPIQPDGTFLAYKGVRQNFRDCHSGTFDNSPGKTIRMDRSKVSPDPSTPCHVGLHVGAIGYARSFGARTLVVRVDPENVVCVPNDHSAMKMRTCEYTVLGLYGDTLPDTSFEADHVAEVEASKPVETKDVVDITAEAESDDTALETTNETPPLPLTGTSWDEFNVMNTDELMEQPLGDLRKYARYNCLITGASKLPGGKDTLVAKIKEVIEADKAARLAKVTVAKQAEPATVVEETPPTPKEEQGVTLPLTGTDWDRFNDMSTVDLLKESIEDLRRYARHNCLIIGASKMGGGKVALIARIAEVRGDAVEKA